MQYPMFCFGVFDRDSRQRLDRVREVPGVVVMLCSHRSAHCEDVAGASARPIKRTKSRFSYTASFPIRSDIGRLV